MQHVVSRLFGELLSPFLWIVMLFLAACLVKRREWKRRLRMAALVLFLLFSNPLLHRLCLSAWEKPLVPAAAITGKANVAVVMGGMASLQESTGRIRFNGSADRLFQALELYRLGYVKKIVISGGNPFLLRRERPEADFLREYLLLLGMPGEDILAEVQSRNTAENARFTAQLFREQGWEPRIVLVTSAFHSRRARYAFEREGFAVVPYDADPTKSIRPVRLTEILIPDPGRFGAWKMLFKEWAGMLVYRLSD